MIKDFSIRDIVTVAMFSAMIIVLGYVAIPLPFSPVPVTGQSLAIMLAGSLLSSRRAGMAVLVFILLGAVGVPVFAGGTAGMGVIVGPRGGYILGFFLAAVLTPLLLKRNNNSLWHFAAANILCGIIIIYTTGVFWLAHVTQRTIIDAITIGALPFIPGDLFKVAVASLAAVRVRKSLGTKLALSGELS